MKVKLIHFLAFIYKIIIFMNFVLIEPVFKISALGRTRYFLAIINILIAIIIYCLKGDMKVNKKIIKYVFGTIFPYILVLIVMVVRALLGENISLFKQIEVFLYWAIPIALMQSAVYLFGYKAIDYTFWTIVLNYCICIISYLVIYKIDGILHFFSYAEKGVTPLEIHELTFTVGLFFIYYVFFENKNVKSHKAKIIWCIICLILGIKRIEIVALIISYGVIVLLSNFNKKQEFKLMICISCFLIIVSILYIICVRIGILDKFAQRFNINFNSRLQAYNYFKDDYNISPIFKGKGLGYVMKKLSTADWHLYGIGDLHNDVLKLYIEFGSILWLIYFSNFLIFQTKRIRIIFGFNISKLYFSLMIFTYILYLTDNVNRYLMYILVFTMIPYCHYLYEVENRKNRRNLNISRKNKYL